MLYSHRTNQVPQRLGRTDRLQMEVQRLTLTLSQAGTKYLTCIYKSSIVAATTLGVSRFGLAVRR